MVESIREAGDKTEPETRFYITSLGRTATQLAPVIRSHWTVESMHWVMDMVFRDDECRVRVPFACPPEDGVQVVAHGISRLLVGPMQPLGAIAGRYGPEARLLHDGVLTVRSRDRLQIVEIGSAVVGLVVLVVGVLDVAVDATPQQPQHGTETRDDRRPRAAGRRGVGPGGAG